MVEKKKRKSRNKSSILLNDRRDFICIGAKLMRSAKQQKVHEDNPFLITVSADGKRLRSNEIQCYSHR